jgi:hypothetical protein
MKTYGGVTENDVYRRLRLRPELNEVNFRQPGSTRS